MVWQLWDPEAPATRSTCVHTCKGACGLCVQRGHLTHSSTQSQNGELAAAGCQAMCRALSTQGRIRCALCIRKAPSLIRANKRAEQLGAWGYMLRKTTATSEDGNSALVYGSDRHSYVPRGLTPTLRCSFVCDFVVSQHSRRGPRLIHRELRKAK